MATRVFHYHVEVPAPPHAACTGGGKLCVCREPDITVSPHGSDKAPAGSVHAFLTWSWQIATAATKAPVRKMMTKTCCPHRANAAWEHVTCWKPLISVKKGFWLYYLTRETAPAYLWWSWEKIRLCLSSCMNLQCWKLMMELSPSDSCKNTEVGEWHPVLLKQSLTNPIRNFFSQYKSFAVNVIDLTIGKMSWTITSDFL